MEAWRRLLILLRWRRFDRDLGEEIDFHLAMKAGANRERGLERDEAHYAAQRQFGNRTLIIERSREMWRWALPDRLAQDLRFTLRMMAKSPAFTAFAVASLALGIGVNTSIFNIVRGLLLEAAPERLVALGLSSTRSGGFDSLATADYESYRDEAGVFESLSIYSPMDYNVRMGDVLESLPGEMVSDNYFSTLGIRPALGRTFAPGLPGIVLGYGFWQRRLGGDAGVIGKALQIAGTAIPILGVAPRNFRGLGAGFAEPPNLWIPFSLHRLAVPAWTDYGRGMHWWDVVGRLKPRIPLAQAQAAVLAVSARLAHDYPDADREWRARLIPFDQVRRMARRPLVNLVIVLSVLAGTVLLITCANLANLLLARAWKRGREMALRVSLGATRGRLLAQLLTESVLLALFGGAAGWILSVWGSRALGRVYFPFRSGAENAADGRLLLFALAVSVVTGIVFGVAPARQASRIDLSSAMARRGRYGMRNTLVAAQVALSLLLLVGAGLFLKTLDNARATDVTLAAKNVLLANIDLAARHYTPERTRQFWPRLLESARRLPGERAASLVYVTPYAGGRGGNDIIFNERRIQVDFNVVAPEYFQTMGIPLLRGRDFNDRDNAVAPPRAIVNEQFARRFFPGQDPIGKTFQMTIPPALAEVVGVVHDGKFRGFRARINPCYYRPLYQAAEVAGKGLTLEIRTAGKPEAIVPALRRAVAALDPGLPLNAVRSWPQQVARSMARENMLAALFSGFGLLALLLASVGTYGVVSFAVAQRTREIGIRLALGASRTTILRDVVGGVLIPAGVGIAVGAAAALALARFVKSMLYGVSAADLRVFSAVIALELGVALAAGYLPGRRAARIEPTEALRSE